MANTLNDLFSFATPTEFRQSIQEVFFSWIIEQPVLPTNYKVTAENLCYLIKLLVEEEIKWPSKPAKK